MRTIQKTLAIGLAAAGLSALSGAAQAAQFLPVTNLTFSIFSGVNPKNQFSAVNPADWFRGPPGGRGDLVFIDAPGTASSFTGGYGVYGPGGSATGFPDPPTGGNFVQADGNPDFFSTFKQTISGLVVGQVYTLDFWQAAGQQQGFEGPTTEQWRVFLGADDVNVDCSTNPCTASSTAEEHNSPLMNTASKGLTPWNLVTMDFTATAASETLTFLAWGDGGSTTNLPPTLFLAGVNTPSVPEPATLTLFGVGLAGLGASVLRRRSKRSTSN